MGVAARLVHWLESVPSPGGGGAAQADDERLQRTLLLGASLAFALAGLLWGGVYLAFGEHLAGAVPISYGLLSLLSVLVYARSGDYARFRFVQLLLILCLPFLLQLALGGFVSSSAVILWSLICPLGALLLGRRQAAGWFGAFALLVLLAGLVQPQVQLTNRLPDWLVLGLFVANITAVSGIAFALLHYFVGQERRALDLLRREREKSERLLRNVLPDEIAARLKEDGGTLAESHSEVSILFADIVGFSRLTDELPPAQAVELLNTVFSDFDRLVESAGLEKIRTIGDSYMVVAGAPRPRADHAQLLACLALAMRDFVAGFDYRGRRLEFRFGMASGPVLAGVIGRQKFHYDVWGDAVNMASRMESHGLPGRIQITRETYALIGETFACEPRGLVEIKGKGPQRTWFLIDERHGTRRE